VCAFGKNVAVTDHSVTENRAKRISFDVKVCLPRISWRGTVTPPYIPSLQHASLRTGGTLRAQFMDSWNTANQKSPRDRGRIGRDAFED